MEFSEVFRINKPVMAMVHLKGYSGEDKRRRWEREIGIYYRSGVDAVIVEDYFGSVPYVYQALEFLRESYPDRIYGVNILDEPEMSMQAALEYKASFIQVDSVCGHLPKDADNAYGEMMKELKKNGVLIMGGVRFKYQPVLSGRSLGEDLGLSKERCGAVVVTGEATGVSTDEDKIREFRGILGDFPLIVGAGLNDMNAFSQLSIADGGIIGSWLKDGHSATGEVNESYVRSFMDIVFRLRERCI